MVGNEATELKGILGLETEPVAVFLLPESSAYPTFDGFPEVTRHRYCQLLMRARHGESLRLMPDEIAEAILVARLMKMATVNDTAADAFDWLGSEKE